MFKNCAIHVIILDTLQNAVCNIQFELWITISTANLKCFVSWYAIFRSIALHQQPPKAKKKKHTSLTYHERWKMRLYGVQLCNFLKIKRWNENDTTRKISKKTFSFQYICTEELFSLVKHLQHAQTIVFLLFQTNKMSLRFIV